jgi:hypothetical protein
MQYVYIIIFAEFKNIMNFMNVFYAWALIDSVMFMDPLVLVIMGILAWILYQYFLSEETTAECVEYTTETESKPRSIVQLHEKVPEDASETIELKVLPLSNILYADMANISETNNGINLLMHVYDKNNNAGVACADENGTVHLKLRKAHNIVYVVINKFGDFVSADKAVIACNLSQPQELVCKSL